MLGSSETDRVVFVGVTRAKLERFPLTVKATPFQLAANNAKRVHIEGWIVGCGGVGESLSYLLQVRGKGESNDVAM